VSDGASTAIQSGRAGGIAINAIDGSGGAASGKYAIATLVFSVNRMRGMSCSGGFSAGDV